MLPQQHLCPFLHALGSLGSPFSLAMAKNYDEGDSSSFLHVTGLLWEAFDILLYVVIPPDHTMHRRCRGRPWSLLPEGMLGLLLCYLGSQMTIKWLCLIFGITPTPCSCILKKIFAWLWSGYAFICLWELPGWAENAAVCGDDKYPWTNDIKLHRIHGRIGIGNGDDWWKNSAECILLRIWLWHNGQQRISIWTRWESIFFVPLIIQGARRMAPSLLIFYRT